MTEGSNALSERRLKELYNQWRSGAIDYQRYSEEVFQMAQGYIREIALRSRPYYHGPSMAPASEEDYVQEAFLAVLEVLPDYDPFQGEFYRFAEKAIKRKIAKVEAKNLYPVSVGASSLGRYRLYRKNKQSGLEHDLSLEKVNVELGQLSSKTIRLLESLETARFTDAATVDGVPSDSERTEIIELIAKALDAREAKLLYLRFYEALDWMEIAFQMKVNETRAMQICEVAIEKLRRHLKA